MRNVTTVADDLTVSPDGAYRRMQTSAKLYLVLDFMNGGHLFFNLYRQGIFDEPQVRALLLPHQLRMYL